jgi:N-acyl amino acid synthase of PEP-CTERM/exosortase system
MRLIFEHHQKLPIQEHGVLKDGEKNGNLPHCVELSRLCVLKEMRRAPKTLFPFNAIQPERQKVEEAEKDSAITARNQNLISRQIIWGLLRAASVYCYNNDITTWYFLTTGAIAKLLRRGGLNLLNIGDACNHRGKRYPFKMSVVETYHNQVWQTGYQNGYSLFSSLCKMPGKFAQVK